MGWFPSLGVERGIFVLLRGYIDESYKGDRFVLACILSSGSRWMELEAAWKRCIGAENRRLKKLGRPPISRYHAADCNSCLKEFKGWTVEEQINFSKQLFQILKNYSTYTVAWDVRISDIITVFPEAKKEPLRACYSILTKFMLDLLGKDIGRSRITLFHDRTDYNGTILEAFNKIVKDPRFPYRENFNTIAPLPSDVCIALQPADLVAYEVLKRAIGKRRKSFDALLDLESFGIRWKPLPLDALQKIKEAMIAGKL
jgi:hypothetical protein